MGKVESGVDGQWWFSCLEMCTTDLPSIELYPDVGILEEQIQMCNTMIVFLVKL